MSFDADSDDKTGREALQAYACVQLCQLAW
jgi:hypothetical protein